MRHTIAEIAEKLGVERESARGLVKFLVAENLVQDMGVRRSESGGRGENLYAFVDGFETTLAARLRKARL